MLPAVLCCIAAPCHGDSAEMVWDGAKWVTPKPPQPGTPQGDLQVIRDYIKAGENKTAIKSVDAFIIRHTASPACEEAMNFAGQASMARGRYWDAYKWYERQLAAYPNGTFFARALDREYKIGDAFMDGRKRRAMKILRLSARDDGIDILMRIVAHAPGTLIAERAMLRIADYHYDREQYLEAIKAYDHFVRSNRQSRQLAYAMLRAAKGTVMLYRGVEFDIAPLLDATVRFQVLRDAFPKLAQRENADTILEEIRLQQAHKQYHTGRFYQRTHHLKAARAYFRSVLARYPGTEWAEKAKEKLDVLGPGESEIPMPLVRETKTSTKFPQQPVSIENLGGSEKPAPPKRVAKTPKPQPVKEISQPVEKKPAPAKPVKSKEVEQKQPDQPEGPAPIPLEKLT